MKKEITTRYVKTIIFVSDKNTVSVRRSTHKSYDHIDGLRRFLANMGVFYTAVHCRWHDVKTIAEIMPETARIEREIDRATGEHEGITRALAAELAAIGPQEPDPTTVKAAEKAGAEAYKQHAIAKLEMLPKRPAYSRVRRALLDIVI